MSVDVIESVSAAFAILLKYVTQTCLTFRAPLHLGIASTHTSQRQRNGTCWSNRDDVMLLPDDLLRGAARSPDHRYVLHHRCSPGISSRYEFSRYSISTRDVGYPEFRFLIFPDTARRCCRYSACSATVVSLPVCVDLRCVVGHGDRRKVNHVFFCPSFGSAVARETMITAEESFMMGAATSTLILFG